MKNILIAGGSGLIGQGLSYYFKDKGYRVSWLSRSQQRNEFPVFYWNPGKCEMDMDALKQVDVIIQLAGSSIAGGRWTKKRKKEILASRIDSINTIYMHLKKENIRVPHIIQASAMGYYGNRDATILDESSSPGSDDFLSEVCKDWEDDADKLKPFTNCLTKLRTSLYLSAKGGVLKEILQTKKFGFIVSFGDGAQYYSWIHCEDYHNAVSFLMDNKIDGRVNMCSPNPVSNKGMILSINNHYNNKLLQFSIPGSLLKLVFGEASSAMLSSCRMAPQVLLKNGFNFSYSKIENAISDLLKKS